jgi:hypothetical protein
VGLDLCASKAWWADHYGHNMSEKKTSGPPSNDPSPEWLATSIAFIKKAFCIRKEIAERTEEAHSFKNLYYNPFLCFSTYA